MPNVLSLRRYETNSLRQQSLCCPLETDTEKPSDAAEAQSTPKIFGVETFFKKTPVFWHWFSLCSIMLEHKYKPTLIKIRLGDIDIEDDFFQVRITSKGESLPFLRKLLNAGVKLKPGILRARASGKYQIIAGSQRIEVWIEKFGPDYEMEFWVYEEDFPDAEAFDVAFDDNSTHGRPLTAKERRMAVRKRLEMDPGLTDTEISERFGVSDRTVGNQRDHVPGARTSERKGRDGKIKKANWSVKKEKKASAHDESNSSSQPKSEDEESHSAITAPEQVSSVESGGEVSQQSAHKENFALISEGNQLLFGFYEANVDSGSAVESNVSVSELSSIQQGLSALSRVCRMHSREFERRAQYIDRILPQSEFSKAELELLSCLAHDMDALQPVDSYEWFQKTGKMRAICHLLSELLAATEDEEDDQASA